MVKLFRFIGFTFLVFLASILSIQAQNDARIKELLDLSRKNSRYPDSLEVYGHKLLEINDDMAQIEGHFAIGYAHYQKSRLDLAASHYDSALALLTPQKEYTTYVRIKRNRAIVDQRMGEFDKAKIGFEDLMNLAVQQKDQRGEASMHNHMGIVYEFKGDFNSAAESFIKAVEIQAKDYPQDLTNSLLNLGTIYGRMNLIDESNRQLKKAAQNAIDTRQSTLLARCYNNISVNFRKNHQLDSSNYYLAFCEKLYKAQNNSAQLSLTYQNKAHNFLELKQPDSARYYLNSARIINDNSGDIYIGSQLDFINAGIELEFGSPEKAIVLINNSITKMLKLNKIEGIDDRYTLLSQAYEKAGNASAALAVMKQWKNLKDSLDYYQNIKTIQEITSAYDFARSEEMIKQSQAKSSFFQKLSTRLGIGLGVLAIISGILIFRYKKKSEEANLKSNEIEELNQKIEELQQINTQNTTKFITLKSKAVIPLEKLMFVQSDGHYLEFFLNEKDRPEIDRGALKEVKEDLPPQSFVQVHRSSIVNINFIREIYANKVILQNGQELNISRSFKTNIDQVFQKRAS